MMNELNDYFYTELVEWMDEGEGGGVLVEEGETARSEAWGEAEIVLSGVSSAWYCFIVSRNLDQTTGMIASSDAHISK